MPEEKIMLKFDIEDILFDKEILQENIQSLINKFEDKYGLCINEIDLYHTQIISTRQKQTYGVQLDIRL